jgi:hypothetical protein
VQVDDSTRAKELQLANNEQVLRWAGAQLHDAIEVEEVGGERVHPIRRVANRTFYYSNGVWTDAEYDEGTATRKIKAFTEEYFELTRRDRRAAQFMAQGQRVIFVLGDVAYETLPGE